MSLKETLRAKLTEATKAGNTTARDVLRVILGDMSQQEARTGKEPTDAEIEKYVRKLIVNNTETCKSLEGHGKTADPRYQQLQNENVYLATLLPQTLGVAEITAALAPVQADLVNAKNDGQAVGVAMKHLKQQKLNVLGEDVSQAVKQLRSGAAGS